MAAAVLDNDAASHADRVAVWLARAEALHDRALTKQESAKLRFEQGRLAELTGDAATAAARYQQAYAIFPHPDIDAGPALRRLSLVSWRQSWDVGPQVRPLLRIRQTCRVPSVIQSDLPAPPGTRPAALSASSGSLPAWPKSRLAFEWKRGGKRTAGESRGQRCRHRRRPGTQLGRRYASSPASMWLKAEYRGPSWPREHPGRSGSRTTSGSATATRPS